MTFDEAMDQTTVEEIEVLENGGSFDDALDQSPEPQFIDENAPVSIPLDPNAPQGLQESEGGIIDTGFDIVEGAGGAVADFVGPTLQGIGETIDPFTGAPVRAGIEAAANLENPLVAGMDNLLGHREAPSSEELGRRALASMDDSTKNKKLSEAYPKWFSNTGSGMSLKQGGIADVSVQDFMNIVIASGADITNLVGGGAFLKGARATKAAAKSAPGAGAAIAGKVVGSIPLKPFAKTSRELAENIKDTSLALKAGAKVTNDTLIKADAAKVIAESSIGDVLAPGSFQGGRMEKVIKSISKLRKQFADVEIPVDKADIERIKSMMTGRAAAAGIDVKDSYFEGLMKDMDTFIDKDSLVIMKDGRVGRQGKVTENGFEVEMFDNFDIDLDSGKLIKEPSKITRNVTNEHIAEIIPSSLDDGYMSVAKLDSLINQTDRLIDFTRKAGQITDKGQSQMLFMLQPILKKARFDMAEMFRRNPDFGTDIANKRRRLHNLHNIKDIGSQGSLADKATNPHSVGILTFGNTMQKASLLMSALPPSLWLKVAAASNIPKKLFRRMNGAYDSGRVQSLFDEMTLALDKPTNITDVPMERALQRLIRHTVVAHDHLEQGLSYDPENSSLDSKKITNPDEVEQYKQELKKDRSKSSIEKAKELDNINRHGYFEIDLGTDFAEYAKEKKRPSGIVDVMELQDVLRSST